MLAGIEKRSANVDMITKNLEKQLDGSPESKVPSKAASTETLKWTRFFISLFALHKNKYSFK